MATTSDDQPADAISLSEALVAYVDFGLVEARRVARERFEAAYGFSPDHIQHSLTDQAEHAARSRYYSACIAIEQAFRERVRSGRLQGWGRDGSPIGPWRRVPAEAWTHVSFVGGDVIKLPGARSRSRFTAWSSSNQRAFLLHSRAQSPPKSGVKPG